MIKNSILVGTILLTGLNTMAQNAVEISTVGNNLAVLLTLIVAIIALIISIVNFFRISYNRKINEVEMVNQKDDLNVSMEAIKVMLQKEIRTLKKDINKGGNRNQKPRPQANNNSIDKQEIDTQVPTNQSTEKKQIKRKPTNYKRRPPHRKKDENKPEQNKTE